MMVMRNQNGVSTALALALWRAAAWRLGDTSPVTRTRFGRYVASLGGRLTPYSAGGAAYTAWARKAHRAGYFNRSHRRHLEALPDLIAFRL